MAKIGIIVDGQGDFAAVKRRLGSTCKILKTDGPRGHTVTIAELARGSRKQINMLRFFGCAGAVVMTDFEQRREPYSKFVSQLALELNKQGFGFNVCPAVPNTMIENWYLADVEQLSRKRSYIKSTLSQRPYEGKHGKRELKQVFKKGESYSEVKHGPELFCTIRFSIAQGNSASFKRFVSCIGASRTRR
jgi:hypothetical protein